MSTANYHITAPLGRRQILTVFSGLLLAMLLANLEANRVGAMPALYQLAGGSGRAASPSRRRLLAVSVIGVGAGTALASRRRSGKGSPSAHRRS